MMSHQSLRMRAAERRHRDRINVHGPELLLALKAMLEAYAPRAEQTAAECGEKSLHPAVRDARELIYKLERPE